MNNFKFFNSVFFVIGNTIGGGMLAMPIVAGMCGFLPAILACLAAFVTMLGSGICLFDAIFEESIAGRKTTLIAVYERHFGKIGKIVFQFFFIFLFFCLLVAYISAFGASFSSVFCCKYEFICLIVGIFFGGFFIKGIRFTAKFNSLLVIFLLLSFVILLLAAIFKIQVANLCSVEWKMFLPAIPVFLCSYGFHNTLPVVNELVEHDRNSAKKVIIVSSVIIFLINLLFLTITIGCLPKYGENSIVNAYQNGLPATIPLAGYLCANFIKILGIVFSFLAISTSYLAVGGSMIKFFQEQEVSQCKILIFVWLAPICVAIIYPSIFIMAINIAAGIGSNTIFVIMPLIMFFKKYIPIKNNGNDH